MFLAIIIIADLHLNQFIIHCFPDAYIFNSPAFNMGYHRQVDIRIGPLDTVNDHNDYIIIALVNNTLKQVNNHFDFDFPFNERVP